MSDVTASTSEIIPMSWKSVMAVITWKLELEFAVMPEYLPIKITILTRKQSRCEFWYGKEIAKYVKH